MFILADYILPSTNVHTIGVGHYQYIIVVLLMPLVLCNALDKEVLFMQVRFTDCALAHNYNRQSEIYAGCLERQLYDILALNSDFWNFDFSGILHQFLGGVSDVR